MTGSGTEADPYIIYAVNDLQAVDNDLNAWYELANDIDASDTVNWNSGAGFSPIGPETSSFQGHFDGRGYNITSLYINRPTTDCVGLFRLIFNAPEVKNFELLQVNITGQDRVGALAGRVASFTGFGVIIKRCRSSGSVTGRAYVGGLIGDYNPTAGTNSELRRCRSTASISSTGNEVGGLAGYIIGGLVSKCCAKGNVSGTGTRIGGFVGQQQGSIRRCFATGSVSAPNGSSVGGFVGYNYTVIKDCYARGAVSGNNRVGGFSGYTSVGGLTRVYSTGAVSGNLDVGGLVGYNDTDPPDNVVASFWDYQTSGQATSAGGTPKSTAQMKTKSTFTDADWDFVDVWDIAATVNDGYPYLRGFLQGGYIWCANNTGETTKLHYTDENEWQRAIEGATTGQSGTAGYLWVETTYLHYIDSAGAERRQEGTAEGATGVTAGHLWIEATKLRYIDASGNERYIEGAVV